MLPTFDGHNDALTRDDHDAIVAGRSGGHLDLPRMRLGGVRAGIFAIFTPSPDAQIEPVSREDGVLEFELAPALDHGEAAAHASAVAGRLLALERAGQAGMPKLLAAFAAGGFSDEEIAMIAWKNWRRTLARWWSA